MSMRTYKCVHSGERDKVCERSFERELNINASLCLVGLKKKKEKKSVCLGPERLRRIDKQGS